MSTKSEQPQSTTTYGYYSPLPPPSPPPPPPPPPPDQYYILLPYQPRHRHRHYFRHLKSTLICLSSLTLFALALFFLWPSDPTLEVVRLRLDHVSLHTTPFISMDIKLAITIKVYNRDFFSLDYNSLDVSIGYRGSELGLVTSNGGYVRARGSSYVNATLDLNGIQILHDVFSLLEDLATGSIPFDTVTMVRGDLGIWFVQLPIEAKVSCEVFVDTDNETIVRQDCYPEVCDASGGVVVLNLDCMCSDGRKIRLHRYLPNGADFGEDTDLALRSEGND